MKVVITGGTGFVGSGLTRAMVGLGADVSVIARPQSDPYRLINEPITWIEGDVTKPETLNGMFDGADYVIHAAGKLGEANTPESLYREIHVEGTRHVLDEVTKVAPIPKVLYISSPGVLGPIVGEAADETAAIAPSNAYERSKAIAEQLVNVYISAGLPIVIGRPEFIYGPEDLHVLGLFQAIKNQRFFFIGNGQNTCHPTYIDDAVDGLLRCLERGNPGEIFHITGPSPVSFQELANTIAETLEVPPPRLHIPKTPAKIGAAGLEFFGRIFRAKPPLSRDGVAFFSENRRFSWQKAKRELGYQPNFNLKSGVSATVEWYKQRGYL